MTLILVPFLTLESVTVFEGQIKLLVQHFQFPSLRFQEQKIHF